MLLKDSSSNQWMTLEFMGIARLRSPAIGQLFKAVTCTYHLSHLVPIEIRR